ncbi:uncharacterized protein PAC_11452 [Phialocephala subalpina]|uniref:Uncharacterized protein n=1 Tax=Phialocephala subalpina TaxID=576137 RepID=A0A1L7X943_9HELO|nr:uncharacterized protein PAC_11452 [Phialocephala subalpina]
MMPRPKRTKVAPSAPAPRLKARGTKSPIRAVAEAPKAFDDLYDVSDPEEGVVTSARLVRKNNGKEKAVASASKKTATEHANNIERAEEIQEPERDRAQAEASDAEPILDDIDLESSSPAVEVRRRESSLARGDSVLAIGNFRRRARQPSILGRGAGRHRSSSVESNLAYDNGLTSVGRKNTSAIGNFRRRPREENVMGGNVAPSSMNLEMDRGTTPQVGSALKLGNFKRREREPSILRTGHKARQQLQYDDEDEEEDDFNPDDESTPLNKAQSRNVTSSSGVSSSNSRKRKLSAVQVPQSSPTLPPQGEVDADDSIPATGERSDEEDEDEEERDPEPVMPSIEARSDTPELLSETMAPPLSSSPTPSSPELPSRMMRAPSRGRRPLRGRTPPPRTQDSPISSPPSLTHSPNRPSMTATKHKPKPKPKRQAPPPSTLSTAQLQALLPRRRRRPAHDTFSIPSSDDEVDVSGLAPDDDELSHLDVRARSRASTALPRQTPAPRRKVTKLKGPIKAVAKGKRTYGRANQTSDKENAAEEEIDPDDSLAPLPDDENESPENSQELEKRVGKELKQAARKFAEVDKWELEFEEVTASSSSPKDAR